MYGVVSWFCILGYNESCDTIIEVSEVLAANIYAYSVDCICYISEVDGDVLKVAELLVLAEILILHMLGQVS